MRTDQISPLLEYLAQDVSAALLANSPRLGLAHGTSIQLADGQILIPKLEGELPVERKANGILRDFCRSIALDLLVPEKAFFRWVTDGAELEIAWRGALNFSVNSGNGTVLAGISVAEGPWCYHRLYPHCYYLRGTLAGTGSDGEPLLDPRSARPASLLMRRDDVFSAFYQKNKDVIEGLAARHAIPPSHLFTFLLGCL